jgi:hypothetical protein
MSGHHQKKDMLTFCSQDPDRIHSVGRAVQGGGSVGCLADCSIGRRYAVLAALMMRGCRDDAPSDLLTQRNKALARGVTSVRIPVAVVLRLLPP